jgi:NAD(P)H-dependent flavin oxidoreductase YrpB (nitropropane dioxygenase family)
MIDSWRRNRLTSTLGIEYPVIQGPLGGLSSQKLTAAVSDFGGLGSFGAHSLAPSAINDAIAQIRSLTSKSFAIICGSRWRTTVPEHRVRPRSTGVSPRFGSIWRR